MSRGKAVRIGTWGQERTFGADKCSVCHNAPELGEYVLVVDCHNAGDLVGCSVMHLDCVREVIAGVPGFADLAVERLLDIGENLANQEEEVSVS